MVAVNHKPGRLTVGVVGPGRVGRVLASALRANGHEVVAVSRASEETLDQVAELLPGVEALDPVEVARGSDLVLLTVPDDAIAATVAWIAKQDGFRPGQLVLHASGRFGTEILRPAIDNGAIPLAVHPAMTFTGTSLDLSRLEGAPFAVTAPAPVLPIGQALVIELGGEPVLLPDAARPAYHAALTHASNHLVTLLAQSQAILRDAGVGPDSDGDPEAQPARMVAPLTRAALERALAVDGLALTGPVSRGDLGTLSEHLAVLDGRQDELATAAAYRTMASATSLLAEHTGRIDATTGAEIRRLMRTPHTGPAPGVLTVVSGIEDLRQMRVRMAGSVAVVPTMGALHEGHLALVRAARSAADHVIVTIFVNPTQFADPSDLAAYPRTLDSDVATLRALGADAPDVVFAPSPAQMYPRGRTSVTVEPGPVGSQLEGASRPGHYAGVLTVVSKLLHLTQPDVAVFGEKDAQQLALVRTMVSDLNLGLWVLSVPVVRDGDGLALSSRNARLSPAARDRALCLSRSVAAAQRLAAAGADADQVVAGARAELAEPGVDLDYAALVQEPTFEPVTAFSRERGESVRYVVAAVVDGVRLLDTGALDILVQ